MSRLRWTIPLAVLPVIALLAYGFWTDPRGEVKSPLIGKAAAPFTLSTFAGTPVSLESLRGRVILVNFWASWCVPACYEEAPVLQEVWRDYERRGLAMVGINVQDKDDAARKFMEQFGFTFPNAMDVGGKVAVNYGVYGVPETFLIDKKGRIRERKVGAVDAEALRGHVERLLAEPS
jgi:cytochrome c biogenesis protein CcmG, thiol:disulfide interchange protein DsbE